MNHETAQALTAAYALDLLVGEELEEFRAHIGGCTACRAELADWQELAALVLLGSAEGPAPATLGQRVLDRVHADPFQFLMADEGHWTQAQPGGSAVKWLSDVSPAGSRLALVRLPAGSGYRAPEAAEYQRHYVIEGSIETGAGTASAGQLMETTEGALEGRAGAEGAVLFLISSGRCREQPGTATISAADAGEWGEMAPGVRYTTLGRDPGNRTELMLVTMEPGSLVDEHDHPGVEELYLLAGDCECAGRILGPGDFHRARATSHHGVTRTRRGCRMLVILHHAKAA